jgi:minor histocompatibility antigen H13
VGSFLACKVTRKSENKVTRLDKPADQEIMSSKDAYMFPVYGSAVLFSIYVLYKFVNKDLLSLIFTAHFMFLGVICVTQMLEVAFYRFFPERF